MFFYATASAYLDCVVPSRASFNERKEHCFFVNHHEEVSTPLPETVERIGTKNLLESLVVSSRRSGDAFEEVAGRSSFNHLDIVEQ